MLCSEVFFYAICRHFGSLQCVGLCKLTADNFLLSRNDLLRRFKMDKDVEKYV